MMIRVVRGIYLPRGPAAVALSRCCSPCTKIWWMISHQFSAALLSALSIGGLADAFVALKSDPQLGSLSRRGTAHSPRLHHGNRSEFLFSIPQTWRPRTTRYVVGTPSRASRHQELEGRKREDESVKTTVGHKATGAVYRHGGVDTEDERHQNGLSRLFATTVAAFIGSGASSAEECYTKRLSSALRHISLGCTSSCAASLLTSVVLLATTDQDIMAAMGSLGAENNTGRPALAPSISSDGKTVTLDSPQQLSGLSGGADDIVGRQARANTNEQGINNGQGNDLGRILQEKGLPQAGPLTHGF